MLSFLKGLHSWLPHPELELLRTTGCILHSSPLALHSEIAKTCIEIAKRLHFLGKSWIWIGVLKVFRALWIFASFFHFIRAAASLGLGEGTLPSQPSCILPVHLHPLERCRIHSTLCFPSPPSSLLAPYYRPLFFLGI